VLADNHPGLVASLRLPAVPASARAPRALLPEVVEAQPVECLQ
jgi:hypothetical protein